MPMGEANKHILLNKTTDLSGHAACRGGSEMVTF
jgi:hypothetical protein